MQHDLATEHRILDAARKVFQSKGMHGARMQDIADKAGINKAMLHYYFRNKEQLFESVFSEALQKLLPAIIGIWQAPVPTEQKIAKFIDGYIEILQANPFLPAFILNEVNQNPERLQKLFVKKGAATIVKSILEQINSTLKKNGVSNTDPRQLLINALSLCVFPFIAKPIITKVMNLSDKEFQSMMQQRKELATKLILHSLKAKS